MTKLEIFASDQSIQALRDRLRGEDNDRRRPGRTDDVIPNLVPLLRGEAAAPDLLVSDDLDLSHGLEHTIPMRGIAVGLAMSIPLWGVLGLLAWAILR